MLIVAAILLVLGAALIVGQDVAVIAAIRRVRRDPKARGYSAVPLVGPALCVAGLASAGARGSLLAIPLALDAGTYSLLFGLAFLVRELLGRREKRRR